MLISIGFECLVEASNTRSAWNQAHYLLKTWWSSELHRHDLLLLIEKGMLNDHREELLQCIQEYGWENKKIHLKPWSPVKHTGKYSTVNNQLRLGLAEWHGAEAHIEVTSKIITAVPTSIPKALVIISKNKRTKNLDQNYIEKQLIDSYRAIAGYDCIAISNQNNCSMHIEKFGIRLTSHQKIPTSITDLVSKKDERHKPSLAWVTQDSLHTESFAQYEEKLLKNLCKHYNITLIKNKDKHNNLSALFPTKDIIWMKKNGGQFERIVYLIEHLKTPLSILECLTLWQGSTFLQDRNLSEPIKILMKPPIDYHQAWLQRLYLNGGYRAITLAYYGHNNNPFGNANSFYDGVIAERSLGILTDTKNIQKVTKDLWSMSDLSVANIETITENSHEDAETYAEKFKNGLENIYTHKKAKEYCVIRNSSFALKNKPLMINATAKAIAENFLPTTRKHQLLIDVSQIIRSDFKTGIQRVVKSLVIELIGIEFKDYNVEPIWLSIRGNEWSYRYARSWTSKLLKIPIIGMKDEAVVFNKGDILLIADLTGNYLIDAHKKGTYKKIIESQVEINTIVYDLLPLQLPSCFPVGTDLMHLQWFNAVRSISSRLLCISKSVANDVEAWLTQKKSHKASHKPQISWFHLGADLSNSSSTKGLPKNLSSCNSYLGDRITFLMVGTVEPRKGHKQTLDAFELLLDCKMPYNLIIVGKKGWMMDKFCADLVHSNYYNKGIFWFEQSSDELLEHLYMVSTCLIAASEGEGFGLPLIEAAKHNLPMLIRDIPVFREVAKHGAYYFSGLYAQDLADAVVDWTRLYRSGEFPRPSEVRWISWHDCAHQVVERMNLETIS